MMSRQHRSIKLIGLVLTLTFFSINSSLVIGQGTPTQAPGQPISPQNAAQVRQFARLGPGLGSIVAWSPDWKTLATTGSSGVWLYDASNLDAEPRLLKWTPHEISALAFSPDGKLLASAGVDLGGFSRQEDNTVRLWDVASGQTLKTLDGQANRFVSMAFSPDGKT